MVDQKKFDELVDNTTKYLQLLMDRVAQLETRVDELESRKTTSRAKGGDA